MSDASKEFARGLADELFGLVDPRDYALIPKQIQQAIDAWNAREIWTTGDFVGAVLRNDLCEAIGRADAISLRGIGAIVLYLMNEVDPRCHGSRENVEKWREETRLLLHKSPQPDGHPGDIDG